MNKTGTLTQEFKDQIAEHSAVYIAMLKTEIQSHQEAIERLQKQVKQWEDFSAMRDSYMLPNQPLSRDYLRQYIQNAGGKLKTVDIIDHLYTGKTQKERSMLIKRTSTILTQMVNEGELIKVTVKGEKGNYYELNKKK